MKFFQQQHFFILLLIIGMFLIFSIDLVTPLGTAAWTPYILIVTFAINLNNLRQLYLLAGITTILMIIGYFLSPTLIKDHSVVYYNRSMGIAAIWAVVFTGSRMIKSKVELNDERQRVQEFNEQLEREAWIDKGYSDLSDILRQSLTVEDIAQKTVDFLAEHLQANVGAFYHVRQGANLRLVGRYALSEEKAGRSLSLHDGYVGQAAAQRKIIKVEQLPANYLHISSATGQVSASHLILLPIITDDELKGVLELGALKAFPKEAENLLKLISDVVAGSINLAEHRLRTVELLEETQRQAEELQSQQEELRVANEELQEQTKALEHAQQEMEKQHTALEESNAELEQQQLKLEESKKNLELVNRNLKKSETALKEKAHELATASQYKSEFLANMSHELRTPLNSILLLSQILADNRTDSLNEEQIDFANTIYSSGNDLLNLINDILDLSKIEAGKVEIQVDDTRLADLLKSLGGVFQVAAQEKGLSFKLSIESDEAIRTDQRRLEQILKNFLSNAVKFTHNGGIEMKLWREHSRREKPIAIAVKDTGISISQEKQQLIFQAFHQADGSTEREYGGTGLGLSIAKELAQLLQAEIEVQSSPDKGSTFILYLPEEIGLTKETGEKAEVEIEKPQVQPKKEEYFPEVHAHIKDEDKQDIDQVLQEKFKDDRDEIVDNHRLIQVIEDDPQFAQVLAKQARQQGFQCILSHSGEKGIEDALKYQPRGIILDLKLPGISGMGVLEYLKKSPQSRHIPVHIISGTEQGRNALFMGAVGYLMKPVDPDSLKKAFMRIEEQHARVVKTVLVVEDDKTQLKSMKAFIEEGGRIEVVGASSGQEALEQLMSSTFDLMILDVHMPGMSGFELLEAMATKEEMSHPPVIVYTGKRLDQDEEERLRKYVDTIIIKSARSPERLLDEMTLFLHRVVADLPSDKQKLLKDLQLRDEALEGTTILLVDDDVRNVYALSYLLEQKGVNVEIARNGKEALGILDRHPNIDLVLMDIMMPIMDGYQAMRAIRQNDRFQKLPIIALTAKTMKGDQEKCYEAGANDYASKPVDAQRLLSLIKVWLAPRGY
ncbi:MAG: response regulator [Oligoflexus sp.]